MIQPEVRTRVHPVTRQLMADLETPISLYLKLRPLGARYLLESAEQGERMGRYSFIGIGAMARMVARRPGVSEILDAGGRRREVHGSPLQGVRQLLAGFDPEPPAADLPPFYGGAVGFLGYDLVHYLEPRVPRFAVDDVGWPEAAFVIARDVVAFDHLTHRVLLVDSCADDRGAAEARLDAIEAAVRGPQPGEARRPARGPAPGGVDANMTPDAYRALVARAKAHIAAGDAFQVVVSQRLQRPLAAAPLDVYRALRSVNPSPYMFFLDFAEEDLAFAGASPEMLVRVRGGVIESRATIAGTRPRGKDPAEDEALAAELRADPKERAEHVMLVDLARNDVGRVAVPGSVRVPELMAVERYAAVMHMVSAVEGRLLPDRDAFDALAAAFPAGTVSGAPKVRAMEILAELEPTRRGPYSGCVGYFGWNGSLDSCITLRTVAMTGGRAYIQAGAGIVADSDPQREYEECHHKARALLRACELAEEGLPR
jgi:anthranilate synthase component 1